MNKKYITLLVFVLFSASILISCSDFLTGDKIDTDPNRPTNVNIDRIFVGIQTWGIGTFNGGMARHCLTWMEQMCGVQRQAAGETKYEYVYGFSTFTGWYGPGGLVDIRKVMTGAEENGNMVFKGMAQFFEGYYLGMASSLFGDIPLSQILQPETYPTPTLDTQISIYQHCQAVLDDAIANLGSGNEGTMLATPASADLFYNGDTSKWIKAAYTLKARLYMHWAKYDKGTYLPLAKAAALNGIDDPADNFTAHYSDIENEQNPFYVYDSGVRSGYYRAGYYGVNLPASRNDPRAALYFSKHEDTGEYRGAMPGEGSDAVSNINPETFRSPAWDCDMISFEENQYILAECYYKGDNDEASAVSAMDQAIDGIWSRWSSYDGFTDDTKPDFTGLTGEALFEEIMLQKYIALYLNVEVYNDYRRTGYPNLTLGPEFAGNPIPRRCFYPQGESNINLNIPDFNAQPLRNTNDPDTIY